MKKTFITLTTFAVVGLGSLFVSQVTHAETIDNLKAKQSEVKDERAELKKDLSEADAKVADVLLDLQEINQEIDALEEELKQNKEMIEVAEENIARTEREIAKIEEEIAVLEAAIEERFEILKQRATSYQKTGGNVGYMEVLFGSTSFNDFISRVAAVSKITESDAELIKKQEEDKAQVEERQAEVEEKLNEHIDMKDELEGMKELIQEQQEENKENQKKLKKKEKELTAIVKELETEDSTLAALESQISRNIDQLQAPAVASNSSSGSNLTTLAKSDKDTSTAPAPSVNAGDLLGVARSQLGTRYTTAGKGPGGFDCSGFVSWAYGQTGKSIPSYTQSLRTMGQSVSYSDAQPGDLVFFNTAGRDGHVGIYLGGGQFIGSQTSTGVAVANMNSGYWKNNFSGHVRRIN